MPIFSFFKGLLSADDAAVSTQQPVQLPDKVTSDKAETFLPPPPLSTLTTASVVSLKSRVETEKQTTPSIYKDFTGNGHADRGHWNDPPTTVFKTGVQRKQQDVVAEKKEEAVEAEAELPEGRTERIEQTTRVFCNVLDGIEKTEMPPLAVRMAEDTRKRLGLMSERLPALDDTIISMLCAIAMLIEDNRLNEALGKHRELLQAGYNSELKWLVAIKRVIELQQKSL
ncbi:hypothetical protein BX070DRAFT_221911, partial [Coemansia spiralis]